MKTYSIRVISLLLAAVLAVSLLPLPTRAAALDYTCTPVRNTGAVITANTAVTASLDDPTLATLSQSGDTVTVSAKPGAVGTVTVSLTAGEQTAQVQVPLGYTTFRFHGDSLTVIPGSDSGYEITGINEKDEEYPDLAPVSADENGDPVYTNTDTYKLCVCVKKKGGTFAFDGTAGDMSIAVKKEATGPAVLLLGDLSLTSSFTAPLTVRKNSTSTVTVTTLAGHTATLADSERNNADLYGETDLLAESAVIKAKTGARLTLNGSGTLKLNCKTKNAVKAGQNASLTVESGNLVITSADHGLSADNTLTIRGGSITIDAQGDAIRSDPDTVDAENGYAGCVNISGGTLTLRAGSDGIQAAQDVTISGGVFDIQTGSGWQDKTKADSRKGIKASHNNDETTDTSEATNTITITGGEFQLNTADDAVHSDAYVFITGGTFRIRTGDDGVHADTRLTLGTQGDTGPLPEVQVLESYEGLEAGHVYIYSGTVRIAASDDGINAAGSSGDNFNPGGGFPGGGGGWPGGGGGFPGGPGGGFPGGGGGGGIPGVAGDYSINIAGGDVYVNVSSDGLDSNGDINLTGGNLVVFGNSANRDGEPLDCDGTLTINGGTVFGAGSRMMVTTPGSASQPYVRYTSNTVSSGKTINVKYNNETVFNIKALKDINYVIYSSPAMTSTTGWTITFDDSPVIEPDDPCKNGHSWDEGVTTPAACTQPGKTVLTCTVCGTSQTQTIPALGHEYLTGYCTRCEAEDPNAKWYTVTFVADGNCAVTVYETQDPNGPKQENAVTALARSGDTGKKDLSGDGQVNFALVPGSGTAVDTLEITAGEGNYKNLKLMDEATQLYRLTKITGDVTVTIRTKSPDCRHRYEATITAPDCTHEGYTTHVCAICGDQYQDDRVPALGHDYTENTVQPSCTKAGYTDHTCSRCGDTYRDAEKAALGHEEKLQNAKAATCTAAGYTGDTVCTRCNETLSTGSVIPAVGHKWGEWITATPATAEREGTQVRTCPVCGRQETKVLPALGHDMVTDPAVAPTCTQPGLTEGAHCTTCDYQVAQQPVPALGHDYVESTVPPTCTKPGYTDHTCSRCGSNYADQQTPALGHSIENGVCVRCGEKAPSQEQPCDGGDTCPGKVFTDMPAAGNWAHAGIDYCVSGGLMTGSTATTFAPSGKMSRAMLATVLYRMAGSPEVTAENPFADVPAGKYYTDAVIWANSQGIVTGKGAGKFAPNDNVTRQELVAMICRYASTVDKRDVTAKGDLSGFADAASVGSYAVSAAAWAVENGILTGKDGKVAPRDTATRAEVAAILMRYCKLN